MRDILTPRAVSFFLPSMYVLYTPQPTGNVRTCTYIYNPSEREMSSYVVAVVDFGVASLGCRNRRRNPFSTAYKRFLQERERMQFD